MLLFETVTEEIEMIVMRYLGLKSKACRYQKQCLRFSENEWYDERKNNSFLNSSSPQVETFAWAMKQVVVRNLKKMSLSTERSLCKWQILPFWNCQHLRLKTFQINWLSASKKLPMGNFMKELKVIVLEKSDIQNRKRLILTTFAFCHSLIVEIIKRGTATKIFAR